MKKLLSILLALTLLLSLGISAFADTQTQEEEALLAYLNELKEKDELQDSDLDTLLGLLGDALKAVPYEEKALPVVRDEVNTTETAAVRLYEDLPEVPYMSVTDFYNRFYLAGTDLSEGMSFTRDGGVYTLTNFCGDKAVFDVNNDTIVIDNVERFIKTAHNHLITESDGYDPDNPFAKTSHSIEPETATPKAIALANYDIDLRGDDTGVYAPLPTLSDIFASGEGYYISYVGGKIYVRDVQGTYLEYSAMEDDPDYLPAVEADRSEALARYIYNELCLNIDLWYGKPGQEAIHEDLMKGSFDDVLSRKYPEIKEMLLSTDFLTFYEGLYKVYYGLLFDGGHTGIGAMPVILDNMDLSRKVAGEIVEKEYGKSYYEYRTGKKERKAQCLEAREALYNGDYYAEQGDTAIIRFDHFIVDNDGWKAFYAGTGERPLVTKDDEDEDTFETIGAVLSGLERAAQNPEIKNVIIDVSCNGGGDDTALLAIEWLLTGVGYVRDKDSLNSQFNTKYQLFDMNFDGVFDDSDVSPYTGYNIGVLTSKCSFSCGNNFPWFMHEHGAMILGEQSSGGACAIRFSSTGGMDIQASSAADCGVNDEGGTIDNGCPVDAELLGEGENPTTGFYDLDTLSALMNEFFSEALDQAA